jgi:hypothetical protein
MNMNILNIYKKLTIMDFNEFKDEIKSVETDKNTALVSAEESETLLTVVMEPTKISRAEAIMAIAIICQKGGTSKKTQGTVYSIVNGKK